MTPHRRHQGRLALDMGLRDRRPDARRRRLDAGALTAPWPPPGSRPSSAPGAWALRRTQSRPSRLSSNDRFVDALKLWRKASERGEATARRRFGIGRLYRNGKGVFMNFAEAVHWYGLASERGHIEAKLELAKLLVSRASIPDASRFRQMRREPDSPETATLSALIYPHGDKVETDANRARALLEEIEPSGDVETAELLARLCLGAWGSAPDYARAKVLLERAAAAGRASGEFGLGDMFFRGIGVEIDRVRAADHYEAPTMRTGAIAMRTST